MPCIGDILEFRVDRFFDGAVQLDWFYDEKKARTAATSFVFHGPKYFGVDANDVGAATHQLVDTCTFTRLICDRLYGESESQNPFVMAIAGYGAGKSHLALTLATLFSGHDPSTVRQVLVNIKAVDEEIGKSIEATISRPNLVLALNGMRDFNLNYEVLNAARKALALHRYDDSILKELTKAHEIALHFLERNFQRLRESFVAAAAERFPDVKPDELLMVLRDSLLVSGDAFEVINQVYYQENGSYIRWDEGISAADILTKLVDHACGDENYFNKILILFDEFGRFIEYAAHYPVSAAESALQQLFETVQNSDGKIVMVGLIQSDLRSYLARVARYSNIIRYVSRYEAAEKVYLSSNLETIFAHLIERKDREAFEHYVRGYHARHFDSLRATHARLLSWLPTASQKSVWREWESFSSVVVEGAYPLHPITTWMLSSLSEWLQQRSALTFVHDALKKFGNTHVDQFGDLPYIRASHIIQSDFFRELLHAEEEGRQQSDVCRQYVGILRKHEHRLSDNDRNVLAANVVARIGRFRTRTREEAELLLAECSGLSLEQVSLSLDFLEVELGVLSFDDHAGAFDFVEDAVGARDFKRLLERKRLTTKINLSLIFDGEIRKILGLDTPQQSGFADRNFIKTQEWDFTQEIVWYEDLSDERLQLYLKEWRSSISPDRPKGRVVWVYVPETKGVSRNVYDNLVQRIARHGLFDTPVVFMLLDDSSGDLYRALLEWQAVRSLSDDEKRTFERFVPAHVEKTETSLRAAFEQLQQRWLRVTPGGIVTASGNVRQIVYETYAKIYQRPVPFMFEGFRAKNLSSVKKNLSYIARNLCAGLVSYQWFHAQNTQVRNRMAEVLFAGRPGAWGVLDADCKLVPPSHPTIRKVYEELTSLLENGRETGVSVSHVLDRLTAPPYGANDHSAALLIAIYLAFNKAAVKVIVDSERLSLSGWAEQAFPDRGVDLRVLRSTTIQHVDLEGARNKYLAICNAIEINSSLQRWPSLKERLDALAKEEEPPEDLKDKVTACRLIAENGCKAWLEYEGFVREQLTHLHRAKENKDVPRALQVVLRCDKQLLRGASLERYAYGPSERKPLQQMIDVAGDVIEKHFESWVNGLRCDNYAQFSSFHEWVAARIREFQSAGYEEYAKRLKAHLSRIESNMEDVKLRQTVKESADRFLQVCTPSAYTSFEQLVAWEDEGKKLVAYIENTLPRPVARAFVEAVSGRLQQVRDYLQRYREELGAIFDSAHELKSLSDCHALLDRARSILDRSLRPTDAEHVREIADALSNLIRDIELLDQVREDPALTRSQLDSLRSKWKPVDTISALPVLDDVLEQRKRKWDWLESQWVSRYLSMSSQEIAQWDAEQCSRWREATATPPLYLREESRTRLAELSQAVSQRLDQIPVLAAVAAYNRLNAEQKRQFLRIITSGSSELRDNRHVI